MREALVAHLHFLAEPRSSRVAVASTTANMSFANIYVYNYYSACLQENAKQLNYDLSASLPIGECFAPTEDSPLVCLSRVDISDGLEI
jgi:hypothetical protein